MTEQEWLTAVDPKSMLELCRRTANDRKLRLVAAACYRRGRQMLYGLQEIDDCVDVAERFADGLASNSQRRATALSRDFSVCASLASAFLAADSSSFDVANETAARISNEPYPWAETHSLLHQEAVGKERAAHTVIVRDIFGNPFRPTALDRSWLNPTVISLAAAIYEERHLPSGLFDNQRLAVLADALEEAGCNDAQVLGHLRDTTAEHVRGCWVIDLALGKE